MDATVLTGLLIPFALTSLGILCGFQGLLTQNPAVFVEIDDIFDFSDTP
jgi:hypothetical protein